MAETVNFLGLYAAVISTAGVLGVAYIGMRGAKITADATTDNQKLTHEDGFRKSLQEQINSLSARLEAEIQHRTDCEEEKTQLRLDHDREIESLISTHRGERHTLRDFIRKQSSFIYRLIELLKDAGVDIKEEEIPKLPN